jgi:hypothetical protein
MAIVAVLLACNILDSGHPNEPAPTLSLAPGEVTLEVGQTVVFVASVTNATLPVEFLLVDPSVAEIISQTDRSVTVRALSVGLTGLLASVEQGNREANASALVRVVPAGGGGSLPTGTRASPRASPEGLQILTPGPTGTTAFGPWADGYVAAFSGASGWSVVDLLTGDVLHNSTGLTGDFFGVAAASQEPPGSTSTAVFVAFGGNGQAVQNVINGAFTATQIGFGTTYDASPAGGRKISDVIPFVRPASGVGFVAYDGAANAYLPTAEQVPAPPSGELVSAYLHDGSGTNLGGGLPPNLLLTRGVQSTVWLNQRDGSASTNVLTLGLDARKLRCIVVPGGGALCGVTLFGADQVATFLWDGASVVTATATVNASDGPVDLDLRLLPNGNIALLTTGFNNGSVVEAELTPAGALVSSETATVPTGCTGAGHAVYVEDDSGLKIVGTCFSSNQYYIVESRF